MRVGRSAHDGGLGVGGREDECWRSLELDVDGRTLLVLEMHDGKQEKGIDARLYASHSASIPARQVSPNIPLHPHPDAQFLQAMH